VLTTLLFLASLLAHEITHSLVARHYGPTVRSITLWLFGGVSDLGGEAPSPAAEAWIAGAGPLAGLLLGVIFIGLALLAGVSPGPRQHRRAQRFRPGLPRRCQRGARHVQRNPGRAAGRRQVAARGHLVAHPRPGEGHGVGGPAGQVFGTVCIAGGLYLFFLTGV